MFKKLTAIVITVGVLFSASALAVTYDNDFVSKVTPVGTYTGKDYTLLHSDGSDQYNVSVKCTNYDLAADSVKIGNDVYAFISTTYGIQVYKMSNAANATDTRKNTSSVIAKHGETDGYSETGIFAPYYVAQTGSVSEKPYVQTSNYLKTVNDSVKIVKVTENGTEKVYLYYTCLYNCVKETEGDNVGKYNNATTSCWNPCIRKVDVTNPSAPVEVAVFVQNDPATVASAIYCDQRYYNKIVVDSANGYVYAFGRDNQNKSNGTIGAYYKDQNVAGDDKIVAPAGYFTENYMNSETDYEYSNGWLYAVKLGAGTEFAVTPYKLDVATAQNTQAVLTKYDDVYLPLSVSNSKRAVRGIEANDNNVFVAFVNSDNTDMTANDAGDGIIVLERTPDADFKLNPVTRFTIPEMTHSVSNTSTPRFGAAAIAMNSDGKVLYVNAMKSQSVLGINVENINKPYMVSTVRMHDVNVEPGAGNIRNMVVTDDLMFSTNGSTVAWANNIDTVGRLMNSYTISEEDVRTDLYYKYMSYYTSNKTDTTVKSNLICAVYDADMNLINVELYSPNITDTKGYNLTDKVYNRVGISTSNENVKYVKAFVWNVTENEILPILPAVVKER